MPLPLSFNATRPQRQPSQARGFELSPLLMRAAGLAILALSVKGLGMCKDIVTARQFGASPSLDAFFVALSTVLFVNSLLAQAFSTAFLPPLVKMREAQGFQAAVAFVQTMLGRVAVTIVGITIVLQLFTQPIVAIVAAGFDEAQLLQAERLFRILTLAAPIAVLSGFWGAVLNASGSFRLPAIAPCALSFSSLVALIGFSSRYGIEALAWGTLVGFALELLILTGGAYLSGWSLLPRRSGHHAAYGVARQSLLILAGGTLMSSSTLIDQSMATWLAPGSVSALNYGYKLTALVLGTIVAGLTTAIFPHFSELVARRDHAQLEQTLWRLVKMLLFGSVPLTILLIACSRWITVLLFDRGAMAPEMLETITLVQICYLLQLPIIAIGMLGARLLTVLEGNSILLRISAVNGVVNLIGNLLLMRWFGVAGIALATSGMYFVSTLLLYRALRRKLDRLRNHMPVPLASLTDAA